MTKNPLREFLIQIGLAIPLGIGFCALWEAAAGREIQRPWGYVVNMGAWLFVFSAIGLLRLVRDEKGES